ncbi:MAG: FHA domain-containing protein [Actinomycetota bacterium]
MLDLHITWPEGSARFTADDGPVQIGRSSTAAVTLTQASVSRRHLELTWDGSSWVAVDNSTHGSYGPTGSRQPERWIVDHDIDLRLGGTEGVVVGLRLVPIADGGADGPTALAVGADGQAGPDSPGGPSVLAPAGVAATPGPVTPAPPPPGPSAPAGSADDQLARPAGRSLLADAGPGADDGVPGPTGANPAVTFGPDSNAVAGGALRLSIDGHDYSFLPGAEVTVGRDPACLVQLEERHSLVSRRHLRIVHRNGAWWIEDYSSKGTWVDHRRLKGPYRAEGNFVAQLGDDEAGTPMRVITAGTHRPGFNANLPLMGLLAAAVLVPLLILAFLLTRGDAEPDFASAKRSTVMLFGLEGGQGSGFFVDDNLILTNQHVAALSSQLLVGVSRSPDEPAKIEYATELVSNHPFLDIAVLRVSNRATIGSNGPEISSEPVGDIGLPAVTIGDSTGVSIGDDVFSTGFPGRLGITSTDNMGELRLPAVAATSGQVVNFAIWPGCSNPDLDTFIPADSPPGVQCSRGGDVERGVLLSTFQSGQGASGSPVFSQNEVIGVVYAGAPDEANASLNIATSTFGQWLAEIVADTP